MRVRLLTANGKIVVQKPECAHVYVCQSAITKRAQQNASMNQKGVTADARRESRRRTSRVGNLQNKSAKAQQKANLEIRGSSSVLLAKDSEDEQAQRREVSFNTQLREWSD